MPFTIKHRVESLEESRTRVLSHNEACDLAQVEKWVREKGYFSRDLVDKMLDDRISLSHPLPYNARFARATFARISEDGARGISTDKFIAEFDSVLDTTLPYVRGAFVEIRRMLLFFSHFPFEPREGEAPERIEVQGFLRALHLHTKLNPFFSGVDPQFVGRVRNGQDVYMIHTEKAKPLSDLRRLLFRSLAQPLAGSDKLDDSPVYIPVFQFWWHEHETGPDGELTNTEHCVLELEDERTVELQDILGMSRTQVFRISTGNSRPAFKSTAANLPHVKHHLSQLGVDAAAFNSLAALLSCIDPDRPGFHLLHELSGREEPLCIVPEGQKYLGHEDFDHILVEKLPWFDVQLSKLIGLLAAERSADGVYKGQDVDLQTIAPGSLDPGQLDVIYLTTHNVFSYCRREAPFSDKTDAAKPTEPCSECRTLGLVGYEEEGDMYWAMPTSAQSV